MCDSTARISTSLWISDFLETCNGTPRRWNRTSLATSLTSRVLSESEDLFLLGSDLGYNSQLYLRPQALFRRRFALVVEFDATSEQSLIAVDSKYIFYQISTCQSLITEKLGESGSTGYALASLRLTPITITNFFSSCVFLLFLFQNIDCSSKYELGFKNVGFGEDSKILENIF